MTSAISTTLQVMTTKNVSKHCQMLPGGQNHPHLRTTVSEPCDLWVIDQKHQRHLGGVRNANSRTLLHIHWVIICILPQFPSDLYAHIRLRSLVVQWLKVVVLKLGCVSKSPWQLMKNTNARRRREPESLCFIPGSTGDLILTKVWESLL